MNGGVPTTSAKVIIDPYLKGRIEEAIEDIHRKNPRLLEPVTHIYALHSNNFGEFHTDDPSAIYINLDLINEKVEQAVKQGVSEEEANTDIIKEAIEEAVRKQLGSTIVHEVTHLERPEAGEGPAEEAGQQYLKSQLLNRRDILLREKEKIFCRIRTVNKLGSRYPAPAWTGTRMLLRDQFRTALNSLAAVTKKIKRFGEIEQIKKEVEKTKENERINFINYIKSLNLE